MYKLLLSYFLIVGSVFGASVDYLNYSIVSSSVVITDCDEAATGDLVIPETIEGLPVTSIAYGAFFNCSSLTSITIPSSVTSIGGGAFENCSSLTSITIPSSVTSIGGGAFENCSSLTSFTIPEGMTSIEGGAFLACRSLPSITIPSSVTSIGASAFDQCSSLTSITIPAGVTSIGDNAFASCASLTSIVFEGPAAPALGVNVFLYVASGATITYPIGATGYSNPFGSLPAMEYSPLSYVITGGQVQITACDTSVTGALEIPATIGGSPVTSIVGGAFQSCINLTSITIPEGVASIGDSAFENCTILANIVFEGLAAPTLGVNVFLNVASGATITYPFGATGYSNPFGGLPVTEEGSPLSYVITGGQVQITACDTSVTGALEIPATIGGAPVTSIGGGAFQSCINLTSITIPEGVASIGDSAFENCTILANIVFEGLAAPTLGVNVFLNVVSGATITYPFGATGYSNPFGGLPVTEEGSPLSYVITGGQVQITACYAYVAGALEIPATIGGAPVTSIGGGAFQSCRYLTSITIPEGVISIGDSAFESCSRLTSVTLPSGVTSIGNSAFNSCSSLTSITIPASVTSIGGAAFYNCSSLPSITIPSSVTSILGYAFMNCSGLTSITISEGVISIGDKAFFDCRSLTSITIPDSVTSIGGEAFSGCSSLTSITIPSSVTSIERLAFYVCSSLTSIVFEGPAAPTLGANVFRYAASGATITYPFGATGYSNPFGGLPASPAGSADTTWYSGASYIANDWRYFDWFKGFKPEGENWIYHGRHGWMYVIADDTSGMFLWDGALGRWMYTNATAYPWMYAYGPGGGWVFFFEGGRPGARYFKRGDNAQTVSEQQLRVNP